MTQPQQGDNRNDNLTRPEHPKEISRGEEVFIEQRGIEVSQANQITQLLTDMKLIVEALRGAEISIDSLSTFHRHSEVWGRVQITTKWNVIRQALSTPSAKQILNQESKPIK